MSHNYHPACGCAACCRKEDADRRADELAAPLIGSADVLSEAMGELSTEQLATMAAHLAAGDDLEFAAVMRKAIARYLDEQIDTRMDRSACSRFGSVAQLLQVYGMSQQVAA